jgi:hypothetical protein
MDTVLVVEVLRSFVVPSQLAIPNPVPGVAVIEMDSPTMYRPARQPGELAGLALGSLPVPEWVDVRA